MRFRFGFTEFGFFFVCLTSSLHHSPDLNWKELSHVTQNLFGENREAHTVSEFLLLLFIFIIYLTGPDLHCSIWDL